jgi:hypothetical protein
LHGRRLLSMIDAGSLLERERSAANRLRRSGRSCAVRIAENRPFAREFLRTGAF